MANYPDIVENIPLEANEDPLDPDGTGTVIDADHWNLIGRLVHALEARVGTTADPIGLTSSHEGRIKLIEALGIVPTIGTAPLGAASGSDYGVDLPDSGFYFTTTGTAGSGRLVRISSTPSPRIFALDISGRTIDETGNIIVGDALLGGVGPIHWVVPQHTIGLFLWDGTKNRLMCSYGGAGSTGGGGGSGTVSVQHEGVAVGTRATLNFRGLAVSASDDATNDRVNVDITGGGGGGGSAHIIKNAGTALPARTNLNFTGFGVVASDDSATDASIVTITGLTFRDEGTPVTQRAVIDFVGAGVTVTDDSTGIRTVVTVPGPAVQSNGTDVPNQPKLNFTGAVSVTNGTGVTNIAIAGSGGSLTFLDEGGSPLTQRAVINFVGPGIAATDDSVNGRTVITVPQFGTSAAGVVPSSGGGTTNFLRADGTWAAPPSSGAGVTVEDEGSGATVVDTLNFVGPGIIVTAVGSVATVGVPYFTGSIAGVVPASPNNSTDFLRSDGVWTAPPGTGGGSGVDVADEGGGPVAATELNFVGAGVTAAVSGGVATVTIPGGGGGGGGEPGIAPQVVPPNAASWTIINGIGTAPNNTRLTDGFDGVVQLVMKGSTGANAQLAVKTIPATPYVVKARIRMNLRGQNNNLAGMCLYDTGGGKISSIIVQNTSSPTIISELQYTSVNAATGQDTVEGTTAAATRDIWFKIEDDGTTRTFAYSYDGDDATWVQLTSVAHTHWHTPNRIGFMGDPQSVNRDNYITLVSWEES